MPALAAVVVVGLITIGCFRTPASKREMVSWPGELFRHSNDPTKQSLKINDFNLVRGWPRPASSDEPMVHWPSREANLNRCTFPA
jgi:hypothetical protein